MSEALSPAFALSEAGSAQLQALQTLSALGWRYISRADADRLRGRRRSRAILDELLAQHLARMNRIQRGERSFAFSEANIQDAVRRLTDVRFDGLLATNEQLTDLLHLGVDPQQTVDGVTRSWKLNYIDWSDWRANDFAMTSEFSVSWDGGETIRADIVLFVNGIPWSVIEVKNARVDALQGVSQQLRNQKPDFGCPTLFFTTQLLIAANNHKPLYGTVGTPAKFWSTWKELEDGESWRGELLNRQTDPIELAAIYDDFGQQAARHKGLMEAGARMITPLDEALVSLCRPERILDLARRFTLFDGPEKKIARFQQFFAVRRLMERVEQRDDKGRRKGGVIWHTQGSGKSLTMVMLAKALASAVPNARIVLVTDRTDLDDQIAKTFRATGLEPERARTGEHLLELVEKRAPVITTVINKFQALLNKRKVADSDPNVFVLVDESHRSQYGDMDSLHEKMRAVFPQACFVGFTGTPIAKRERNTFLKFGDLVQPAYSMRDAVADGAVVPLLYEGRHVEEDVDDKAIDSWFERVTRGLTDKQIADLKKKMSRPREMLGVTARLKCIAFDVSEHFAENFKDKGLKGQLVAPSKKDAVLLKQLIDGFGKISCEVIISAPDTREHENDLLEESSDEVKKFWARMMALYKSEEEYNRQIIERFKGPEDPDILIVVSKLLTGFDVKRNAVLYLARPLREHDLLQAIARVNRVFDQEGAPEKPFGYIIDYSGVLQNLSDALGFYDQLQGFEPGDVAGSLAAIAEQADALPDKHAALLDLFTGVANAFDEEAYARELSDASLREEFYKRLSAFSRAYEVATVSRDFVERARKSDLERWRSDRLRFLALRQHVRVRYGEAVDFSDYEKRIRDLLNQHVTAHEITRVVDPINIFDDDAIRAARKEGRRSEGSIADEIAHRLSRSIQEKWDEDPVFYEKFSTLIRQVIDAFKDKRLDEKSYLARVVELRDKVDAREDDTDPVPPALKGNGHAIAFWGIARKHIASVRPDRSKLAAKVSMAALGVIQRHAIVGWQHDPEAENVIRNELDDYFFDELKPTDGDWLSAEIMDAMVSDILASARVRLAR
ncbi:MAG: type I restriction endonuclease subunit R [Hyphomonadaceae bacterium]|nr:type I restriction endonuclease subunit R [Hyphomonadaceae bacterium]